MARGPASPEAKSSSGADTGSAPAPGAAQGAVLAGGAGPQGELSVVCVRRAACTHDRLTPLRNEREQGRRSLLGRPAASVTHSGPRRGGFQGP